MPIGKKSIVSVSMMPAQSPGGKGEGRELIPFGKRQAVVCCLPYQIGVGVQVLPHHGGMDDVARPE
ncbi:MAG: hypothetical protein WD182_00825 [Bacteroidota bacterium]